MTGSPALHSSTHMTNTSILVANCSTRDLADLVVHNLKHQHEWQDVKIHILDSDYRDEIDQVFAPLFHKSCPRQLISGLPPRRMYIHPDEQIAALEFEKRTGTRPELNPEYEWVLPVQLNEEWSVQDFSAMFAVIDVFGDTKVRDGWTRSFKQKRLILGIVHGDSTVAYYIMHDGVVKPRQN